MHQKIILSNRVFKNFNLTLKQACWINYGLTYN